MNYVTAKKLMTQNQQVARREWPQGKKAFINPSKGGDSSELNDFIDTTTGENISQQDELATDWEEA